MLERLANRKLPQRFIQARKDRRASRRNTEKKARERPRTSRATYDLWAGMCEPCSVERELLHLLNKVLNHVSLRSPHTTNWVKTLCYS